MEAGGHVLILNKPSILANAFQLKPKAPPGITSPVHGHTCNKTSIRWYVLVWQSSARRLIQDKTVNRAALKVSIRDISALNALASRSGP